MLKNIIFAVALFIITNSTCSSALVFKPAQAILRSPNSRGLLIAARSSVRMLHSVSPNYTTDREVREIGESYWNINMAKELISKKKGFAAMRATEGAFVFLGIATAGPSLSEMIEGVIIYGFWGLLPSCIALGIGSNLRIPVDELKEKIKEIK